MDAQGAEGVLPYRPEWLGDPERGVIHTGVITTLAAYAKPGAHLTCCVRSCSR